MARIALIGCGKMGMALVRGWVGAGIADHIHIVEPQNGFKQPCFSSTIYPGLSDLVSAKPAFDTLVLAVKPQLIDDACVALKSIVPANVLVLSIAAGRTVPSIAQHFDKTQPVVRAMPNLPAAIGLGMTVAVANKNVKDEHRANADKLLRSVGGLEWVNDENLMDAVTALSGSGPAYIFLLIEALAKAGENVGLAPDLAMALARQTVIGSAAMAAHDHAASAETLRQNVTSPGGTTAAALKVLMDGEFQKILNRALEAATERSKDLSN